MNIHQEEEEESFVMTSLLAAAEEGNVDAINELMENSSHFDVNLSNRVRLDCLFTLTTGWKVYFYDPATLKNPAHYLKLKHEMVENLFFYGAIFS